MNGTQCGSPALRRRRHCVFHEHSAGAGANCGGCLRSSRLICRCSNTLAPRADGADEHDPGARLRPPGHKTAGVMLYAPQTASSDLRHATFEVIRCHRNPDRPRRRASHLHWRGGSKRILKGRAVPPKKRRKKRTSKKKTRKRQDEEPRRVERIAIRESYGPFSANPRYRPKLANAVSRIAAMRKINAK